MAGQLIDNAAKFTQNGKIEFIANRVPDKDDDLLVVDIIDTGIGICPARSRTFSKNSPSPTIQRANTAERDWGWPSAKICKLMGGEISVESSLGEGSRFTIRMPLTTGRPAHRRSRCGNACTGCFRRLARARPRKSIMHKILLVEDNEMNRDMLTRRLQRSRLFGLLRPRRSRRRRDVRKRRCRT